MVIESTPTHWNRTTTNFDRLVGLMPQRRAGRTGIGHLPGADQVHHGINCPLECLLAIPGQDLVWPPHHHAGACIEPGHGPWEGLRIAALYTYMWSNVQQVLLGFWWFSLLEVPCRLM